ncbi:MAG: YdcF family protein [Oscillospiraceae bacterium]
MKRKPWLIAALCCFLLAAFFKFALIGYSYIAALLAGVGLVILLYLLFARLGKKILSRVLTVLLCLGAAAFLLIEIPIVRESRGDEPVDTDYLIVLGAGVNGSTPSLSMVNRLEKALEYLESHPACTAILSGGQGQGEDISEARAMYDWLCARGVDPARLILEDRAASTQENIRFSYELMGDKADTAAVAVVSSEYHLCRAKAIASRLGRTVYGLPAKTTYPVLKANYFIREAFGMVHLFVFGV